MKRLLCFIDDSLAERELFQEVFGSAEGRFDVIGAESFLEAERALAAHHKKPDLFVLDLYFPGGDIVEEEPPSAPQSPIFSDDGGDLTRAFLNLEVARQRFQSLRLALGQSPRGGLALLQQVQAAFPGVPCVTYTRKGTIEEANWAYQAGARRVLLKPSGDTWDATRELTTSLRGTLESEFERIMKDDPYELLNLITHYVHRLERLEVGARMIPRFALIRESLNHTSGAAHSSEIWSKLTQLSQSPLVIALLERLRVAVQEEPTG